MTLLLLFHIILFFTNNFKIISNIFQNWCPIPKSHIKIFIDPILPFFMKWSNHNFIKLFVFIWKSISQNEFVRKVFYFNLKFVKLSLDRFSPFFKIQKYNKVTQELTRDILMSIKNSLIIKITSFKNGWKR